MKRFPFRRKALLRSLHAAALAFLFWAAAQRQAGAQALTAPFFLSGTAATTGTGTFSGAYGFYDPAHTDTLVIGAGTSVTNTTGSGYGAGSGASATPYAAVTLGAGTVQNFGTLAFQAAAPGSTTHYFAGLAIGALGNSSVDNFGTISISATTSNQTILARPVSLLNTGSASLAFVNERGATLSGNSAATNTGSGYAYGFYANPAAGTVSLVNAGTISGVGSATASVGSFHIGEGLGARFALTSGSATIANTGTISGYGLVDGSATNLTVRGYGIDITSSAAGAAATITNGGTLSASAVSRVTGSVSAYGINFQATAASRATITNTGTIVTSVSGADASYAAGYGIFMSGFGAGTTALGITNSGTVQVTSTSTSYIAGAIGFDLNTDAINGSTASSTLTISNSGRVTASISGSGNGSAIGFIAGSPYGSSVIRLLNDGTVTASSSSSAYGIEGNSSVNTLSSLYVRNTGSITAGAPISYGILLTSIGQVYNTGSITAGTAAISVPSGSLVTLAGASAITGLIKGGADASSTSALNFDVDVRTNYIATVSSVQAALTFYAAAYRTANGTGNVDGSVVINGRTYTFEDFGTVAQALVDASYSHMAGFSSLGSSLDALGSSANANAIALLTALNNLPTSSLPAALAQLSPAKVSQQLTTQPFHQAVFQNMQLGDRLTQVRQGFGGGADWSGLQYVDGSDPLLSQIQGKLYAYNPPHRDTVTDATDTLSSSDQFNRWGTFLTGNAVLVNQSATATQNHVDSTTVDLTAGADYRIDKNWAAGFLFGYGKTAASVDDLGSRVTNNQYRVGPYVGYNDGPWYANASGYFAFNDQSSKREIPFLGETAQANPFGTQYGAAADGGYEFKALDKKLTFGPTGGLQYTHLDIDPYTESGSSADLHVEAQHADSLISSLGAKADYDLHWKWNNATVRPELRASWLHEFMGNENTVGAAFDVPGSASFTVASQRQQRDSALVGTGVQNIFPGGSLLYLDYDAQVGIDNYLAQSITGGFKVVF